MKILFTGLPGSGKTTQARMLASELGLPLISMGAVLRTLAMEEHAVGQSIKEALDKGDFVDDELVAELMQKRIAQKDCKKGFVMDGYPRSFSQLKFFDPEFDQVFYLIVPEKQASKRLTQRHREDDTPELIKKRLKIQEDALEDLLYFFKKLDVLTEIDGDETVEDVHISIRKNLI